MAVSLPSLVFSSLAALIATAKFGNQLALEILLSLANGSLIIYHVGRLALLKGCADIGVYSLSLIYCGNSTLGICVGAVGLY